MLTLQIQNQEIENFIDDRYGKDTQSLWKDFTAFVKVSLSDNYPSITAEEAKRRVDIALREIDEEDKKRFRKTYKGMKDGSVKMFSQDEAKKEIDDFLETL